MKGFSAVMALILLSFATLAAVYADSGRDDRRSSEGVEIGDDRGGDTRRSNRIEIGDDRSARDQKARVGSGFFYTGGVNYGSGRSTLTGAQLACVRTAIIVRENALSSQFSTLASVVTSAHAVRSSALANAWTLTDATARRQTIDSAWATWKSSVRVARETRKTAHKSTWDTFRTSVRACNVSQSQVVDFSKSSLEDL